MSYSVSIRPEAEGDLVQGFDWYEARRDGLGYEFLREVEIVLNGIGESPLKYAETYLTVRRALLRRFPYKVYYVFEADRIDIIGVVHVKRAPQFWQKRLPK